jgi:predicted ATP-dependent serine protease
MDWVKGTGDREDPDYKEGSGISVIIIAHVDKKGNISGPKMLEHFVDTVLMFSGSRLARPRLLSSDKNRFGDTTKIANFDMTKRGLVEKPSPQVYDDFEDEDEEDNEPLNTFGNDEEDDDLEDEEDGLENEE